MPGAVARLYLFGGDPIAIVSSVGAKLEGRRLSACASEVAPVVHEQ